MTSTTPTTPTTAPTTEAPQTPFPIVGIGASAGGLKALTSLLSAIPADTGMGFVVIQHLDPSHESYLPSLLARHSQVPIEDAVDGCVVQPNRVYVITPNTCIAIEHGVLRIAPRVAGPAAHLAIDMFLRSLAADRPGRAVGVILSGTGTDGTFGLAAIKDAGGITFAQDDSADYGGMPLSAIGHGHVDFVLHPAEIATEIGKLGHFGFPCLNQPPAVELPSADQPEQQPSEQTSKQTSEQTAGQPTDPQDVVSDPLAYARIIALLHTATGIDYTHYRSTTIMRRTVRRMALIPRKTLSEYADYLDKSPIEVEGLARDVLINVTSFYRDHAAFAALKSQVFPLWSHERGTDGPIRLWIVGCSTGQEVYSLAMELVEHLSGTPLGSRLQIFATDISDWALAKARHGSYPASIADEVPAERLAQYFTREESGWRINKEIRDLCVFAKHDITADTPFSRMDLISCRNVLIYLGPVLQNRVLPTFHFALKPGGFLLLGTSETLGQTSNLYATIDEKNRLYRSIAAPRRLTVRPPAPMRSGDAGMPVPPPTFSPSVSEMQRAADQILLGRFAPAGVLVTEALEIIQFRGQTNRFLQPAQGEVSLDLLTMVPFGVAEALRSALDESKRLNLSVRRDHVVHCCAQSIREIAFEVTPIRLPTSSTCYLILFEESADESGGETGEKSDQATRVETDDHQAALPASSPTITASGLARQEPLHLRSELVAATNYVHSLVGANHTLTEQLKEAQEEAQSGSEEYRSTNEELQTAKEEVESTNQELITINDELRSVNEDLGKASAALRRSSDLTSAIVDTMRYPLLVLAPNLRVESANQAFLDAFGVNRGETIGRLVYDLGNGQWNIPELRRLLEDILPSNSVFDDYEVTHDFGHIGRRTMLLNARRLQGTDDQSRLIVLVIADITERTRVSQDLRDTASEQLRSNAELDQFAAVASHDLKEPLRMISNYIDLLQRRYEPLFDEQARRYMSEVTSGAQRMTVMIDAILTYSRLGHEATGVTMTDSILALDSARDSLKTKTERAHATIEVTALPRVLANHDQLTQLFQNLLSNALKFRSAQRPPIIHVSATTDEQQWIFAVADNGIGMEAASFGRIFELFHRAHADHDVQGCSIGLATCKKIIEHHKGRIWVESTLGVGSTFFFSLPH